MRRQREARPRAVLVVAVALFVSITHVTPVLAWSNGTEGCNSFGTHDLVLSAALAFSNAHWVQRRVALRATDDPDCKDGLDHASGSWWHVYDRWGDPYGGADEAARVWFERMKRRLDAGKERGASRALGILAHIIGDVAQPMHTDQRDREERIHSSHEDAVDRRTYDYGFVFDQTDDVEPDVLVQSLARDAHRHYFDLIRAYDRHGYNGEVDRITDRQLNRAANAVADLIKSLR